MKKAFDCVEMKRAAQERIYAETRGLSRDEELSYYHRAAAECRVHLKRLREEITAGQRRPPLAADVP